MLAIKTSRTDTHSLNVHMAADRYTLSAEKLDEVRLNGEPLKLQDHNGVPHLRPERVPAGRMNFGPTTITFVAVPEAGNGSCR